MSARRARARTSAAVCTCRTPFGSDRDTDRTGYGRGSGGASAVVTTSTSWPRRNRNEATSGAWLAGPPTSGGQMPDTIKTLTLSAPILAAPVGGADGRAGKPARPGIGTASGASRDGKLLCRGRRGHDNVGLAPDPEVQHRPVRAERGARREDRTRRA